MLEAVGHPVAVNPDKELARIAREREWPIMRFNRPVAMRRRSPTVPDLTSVELTRGSDTRQRLIAVSRREVLFLVGRRMRQQPCLPRTARTYPAVQDAFRADVLVTAQSARANAAPRCTAAA